MLFRSGPIISPRSPSTPMAVCTCLQPVQLQRRWPALTTWSLWLLMEVVFLFLGLIFIAPFISRYPITQFAINITRKIMKWNLSQISCILDIRKLHYLYFKCQHCRLSAPRGHGFRHSARADTRRAREPCEFQEEGKRLMDGLN